MRLRRPAVAATRTATVIALFNAPVAVAGLAAVGSQHVVSWSIAVTMLLAVVGASQLVQAHTLYIALVGGAAVVAAVLVMMAVPLLVLQHRGERVEATVVAARTVQNFRTPEDRYRLIDSDGRILPGELADTKGTYALGDRVEVVYDPNGVLDPQPGYMDGTGPELVAVAGVLVVLEIGLAFPAVRQLDGVSPPRRTKLGVWVFPR